MARYAGQNTFMGKNLPPTNNFSMNFAPRQPLGPQNALGGTPTKPNPAAAPQPPSMSMATAQGVQGKALQKLGEARPDGVVARESVSSRLGNMAGEAVAPRTQGRIERAGGENIRKTAQLLDSLGNALGETAYTELSRQGETVKEATFSARKKGKSAKSAKSSAGKAGAGGGNVQGAPDATARNIRTNAGGGVASIRVARPMRTIRTARGPIGGRFQKFGSIADAAPPPGSPTSLPPDPTTGVPSDAGGDPASGTPGEPGVADVPPPPPDPMAQFFPGAPMAQPALPFRSMPPESAFLFGDMPNLNERRRDASQDMTNAMLAVGGKSANYKSAFYKRALQINPTLLTPLVVGGAETVADTTAQAINNPDHPRRSGLRALIAGLGTTAGMTGGAYLGAKSSNPYGGLIGSAIGAVGGGALGAGASRVLVPGENKEASCASKQGNRDGGDPGRRPYLAVSGRSGAAELPGRGPDVSSLRKSAEAPERGGASRAHQARIGGEQRALEPRYQANRTAALLGQLAAHTKRASVELPASMSATKDCPECGIGFKGSKQRCPYCAVDLVPHRMRKRGAVEPGEACPHCNTMHERGDDGVCNRCGAPWPEKRGATSLHRDLDRAEREDVAKMESRPFSDLIWGSGTPLSHTLSSPRKGAVVKGLGGALAGGGLGAGLGTLAAQHGLDPQAALVGGLGGAALGGLAGAASGYFGRHRWNEDTKDLMRRLPPGATYRDYQSDAGDGYGNDRIDNLRASRTISRRLAEMMDREDPYKQASLAGTLGGFAGRGLVGLGRGVMAGGRAAAPVLGNMARQAGAGVAQAGRAAAPVIGNAVRRAGAGAAGAARGVGGAMRGAMSAGAPQAAAPQAATRVPAYLQAAVDHARSSLPPANAEQVVQKMQAAYASGVPESAIVAQYSKRIGAMNAARPAQAVAPRVAQPPTRAAAPPGMQFQPDKSGLQQAGEFAGGVGLGLGGAGAIGYGGIQAYRGMNQKGGSDREKSGAAPKHDLVHASKHIVSHFLAKFIKGLRTTGTQAVEKHASGDAVEHYGKNMTPDRPCPECGKMIPARGVCKCRGKKASLITLDEIDRYAKQAGVLAHVGGVGGAGKTTLLAKLQAKHPGLVTKDLDDLDEQAKGELGLGSGHEGWKDEDFSRHQDKFQSLLDGFVSSHSDRPVVLGGFHMTGKHGVLNVPAENRVMLDTGPLKSTVRAFGRSHRAGSPMSLRDAVSHYSSARKDSAEWKGLGYKPQSSGDIERLVSDSLGKTAAQDNSANPTSATGESQGLTYQNKPDHYMHGQDAWESVGQYFKMGTKHKPNPFMGKHAFSLGDQDKSVVQPPMTHQDPTPTTSFERIQAGSSTPGRGPDQGEMGKTAGLTPFAQGFFSRCDSMGYDFATTKALLEKVAEEVGGVGAEELYAGMEKVAVPLPNFGAMAGKAWQGLRGQFGPGISKGWQAMHGALPRFAAGAPAAQRAAQGFLPGMAPAAQHAAQGFLPGMAPGAQNATRSLMSHVAPTATGAMIGGFSGDTFGMGTDSYEIPLIGMHFNPVSAMAGAAAFNPGLRRMSRTNMGRVPLSVIRGGMGGEFAGSMLDQATGAAGYDTNFARVGAGLGIAAGGLGAAGRLAARSPGIQNAMGRGAFQQASVANRMFNRGAGEFAQGAMNHGPMAAMAYPFRAAKSMFHGTPLPRFGMGAAPTTAMGRVGRVAGLGTAGLMGAGMATSMGGQALSNRADEYLADRYQQLMPQMQRDTDQYMQEKGLLDQHGQFNPLGNAASSFLQNVGEQGQNAMQYLGRRAAPFVANLRAFTAGRGGPEPAGWSSGTPGMFQNAGTPMPGEASQGVPSMFQGPGAGMQQPAWNAHGPTALQHTIEPGYRNEFLQQAGPRS